MAIHNCPQCGAIVPYAGAQCSNCARRRENERRSMNSGSGSGSRSGNSGNVTYSGGSSYSTGHSGGKSSILPIFAVIIVIALVVGIVYGVISVNNREETLWKGLEITGEASRSLEDYQSYLLSMDDENAFWSIECETSKTGFFQKLFNIKEKSYYISGETANGITSYHFNFDGENLSTGLPDGEYTLTILDGANVLIDDEKKIIYKEGSDFYAQYADKLKAITHDSLYTALFDKCNKHGLANEDGITREALCGDNAAVYNFIDESDPLKAADNVVEGVSFLSDGKLCESYTFTYGSNAASLDLKGYTYSDATVTDDDELGKLIENSRGNSGGYTLYKNDEEVADITTRYLANGYEFSFYADWKNFDADATYRVNTNAKTLTKVSYDEQYAEVLTDMPLSEYQAEYDYLLSVVPDIYIRNIIDMNKAEIVKENSGMVKNYKMKDANGNVTVEMKVAFGKIAEVLHYISDSEYVKVELEY